MTRYFNDNKDRLDEDSSRRLKTNPLRILDSKNKDLEALISEAPKMIDHLDKESNEHFEALKNYLEHLDIQYTVNPKLVRGLDYSIKLFLNGYQMSLALRGQFVEEEI